MGKSMSRGPGYVEKTLVANMQRLVRPTTRELAASVFEVPEEALTASQLGSVRRALRRLAARGDVQGSHHRAAPSNWRIAPRLRRPPSAPEPLGEAAQHVPFAGSTRTLGLRRTPVARQRGRR
jgi:hypothetical protein